MKNRRSARLMYQLTTAIALAFLAGACASNVQRDYTASKSTDLAGSDEQTDHSEMLLRYCKKMYDAKDLYVAASMCRRAFEVNPTDPAPLFPLAEIYGEMGATESKADAYRMALKINPDDEEALYGLAKTSIDLGRYDIAVAQLERALQINSKDPRYYNAMGVAKDQMRDHDAAQKLYRAGLRIDRDNVSLRNNLGLSLTLSGRHDESVAMLREVASEPEAGTVGSRNLAHAATNAAGFDSEMAKIPMADGEPMEILSSEVVGEEEDMATAEEDMVEVEMIEDDSAERSPMAAAMSKPMSDDEASGSIGSATGTTGDSETGPDNAASMPTAVFANQSSSDVPSPDEIKSNLEDSQMAALPTLSDTGAGISYTVQIGSYKSKEGAEKGWRIMSGKAKNLLGNTPHSITQAELGGATGTMYRLRAGTLPNRATAAQFCSDLSDYDIGCYVVRLPEPPPPAAAAEATTSAVTVDQPAEDQETQAAPAEKAGEESEG